LAYVSLASILLDFRGRSHPLAVLDAIADVIGRPDRPSVALAGVQIRIKLVVRLGNLFFGEDEAVHVVNLQVVIDV